MGGTGRDGSYISYVCINKYIYYMCVYMYIYLYVCINILNIYIYTVVSIHAVHSHAIRLPGPETFVSDRH